MILSATIIVILAVALHYTWAIKQWISTKLYVTFALLIFVLITIFCQEFLFMSSDDESGEKTNKSNTLVEESAKKSKDNTSPSNPNYNEADDDTENLSDSSSDDDES
jgi:Tfp pilus assembly protein PilO